MTNSLETNVYSDSLDIEEVLRKKLLFTMAKIESERQSLSVVPKAIEDHYSMWMEKAAEESGQVRDLNYKPSENNWQEIIDEGLKLLHEYETLNNFKHTNTPSGREKIM